jgi:hypothetical protein
MRPSKRQPAIPERKRSGGMFDTYILSFDGEKQLLQNLSKWDPGRNLA